VKTVPLAEIAEVRLGRQRSPKNHSGPQERKYLRAANVGWEGLKLDDIKTMNFTDAEMETYKLRPGDLLLNEASGSRNEVGKPAIWMGEIEECAFQNTLLRVRPTPQVDFRYLYFFLRQQAAVGAFARGSRGAAIHHLGREALCKWPIPLPALDEQRRIAAILDQAEHVQNRRREVADLLRELIPAFFIEAFGDQLGAPTTTRLDEVADVSSGITKGRKTLEPTSPVPYLAVVNVQAGHLVMEPLKEIDATEAEIARYSLKDGDLVLTEGGDPDKLGRGTVWRSEVPLCLHQNHIFRVRIRPESKVEPDYLSAYLASWTARSYFLRSAKQTTGIASINMTQLRALPVLVPPLPQQRQFLDRLEAVTRQAALCEQQLAEIEPLTSSIQSRAFSGHL
jgi:type I restriction enzyme S subunit